MVSINLKEFMPDYAVAPGATLEETIGFLGISQVELARRMGRPVKLINEIIHGKAAITSQTAIELERVVGISARIWSNLQRNYEDALARIEETRRSREHVDWMRKFPVSEMIKRGWLDERQGNSAQLSALLEFLGVSSPEAWEATQANLEVSFRMGKVKTLKRELVSVWLRRGEILAQKLECAPYSKDKLQSALPLFRKLASRPPEQFQTRVESLAAECGVAVVFVKELKGLGISGATRWLTPSKALVQLSLRYKTEDQLWFTFFHELCHILRHGKRAIFLEVEAGGREEDEADEFAADVLIPEDAYSRLMQSGAYRSKAAITRFAKSIGVSPGIVVGRLQHDGVLPRSHCNDLKMKLAEKEPYVRFVAEGSD